MNIELLEKSRNIIDKHIQEIRKVLEEVQTELGDDKSMIQPVIDKLDEFENCL
jgi:DNA-binding MarR family transcriptional regulator